MNRILRGALLAVTGAAVLAGAGTAVVVAEQHPPEDAAPVTFPEVDVPAGPLTQACPGPALLTTGEGMAVDPEVDPEDTESRVRTRVLTLPRSGALDAAEAVYGEDDLAREGDIRLLALTDPEEGGLLTAQPAEEVAALSGGLTLTRANAGDLRGLAAGPCQSPASTTWLVGGGADLGQSARLVLTNTGDTPAVAEVTLWSSLGPVDAPQLSEITVAPGGEEDLLLESLTSDPALALRVDSAGGNLVAALQDLQLDGIVAAGVDQVSAAAPPALSVVVPGVVLPEDADGDEDGDTGEEAEGSDAAVSRLRLINPGEEVATAAVRLLGDDGAVEIPGAEEVVLDPGAVVDLSLRGIEPGAYAVEVESDEPVTGAVVLAREGEPGPLDPSTAPVDRAWAPAVEAVGTALIPLLGGALTGDPVVLLTNAGEEDVEVELRAVGADGALAEPAELTVPARSTVTREASELVDGALAVQVLAEGPLASAAVLTAQIGDGELITAVPAQPDAQEERAVRVDLR